MHAWQINFLNLILVSFQDKNMFVSSGTSMLLVIIQVNLDISCILYHFIYNWTLVVFVALMEIKLLAFLLASSSRDENSSWLEPQTTNLLLKSRYDVRKDIRSPTFLWIDICLMVTKRKELVVYLVLLRGSLPHPPYINLGRKWTLNCYWWWWLPLEYI